MIMRSDNFTEIFNSYKASECTVKGTQPPNLNPSVTKGLRSLSSRAKKGELLIVETDKSGKFATCTKESYLEMGTPHTSNDREISRIEVMELQKRVNGHVAMWAKDTQLGST